MLALRILKDVLHRKGTFLRCAALLPAALGLLGCAGPAQLAGGPPPALSPSAAVSFCDNTAAGCAAAATFSLQSLRDLNVVVNWQNLPAGTHAQTVNVFLPDGNLYQTFETSFEVPEGSPGSMTTGAALPVAGTWITQRGLSGAWNFTLALDGQTMTTQSVQLTP